MHTVRILCLKKAILQGIMKSGSNIGDERVVVQISHSQYLLGIQCVVS